MMRRIAVLLGLVIAVGFFPNSVSAAPTGGCGSLLTGRCGVHGNANEGDFHGLIMVPGQPGVLETAAHSGTVAGCGDCTWSVIIACLFDSPTSAHEQTPCAAAGQAQQCARGQTLFRLYLTTHAVRDQLVDTLCLGGRVRIIPIGDIAAADVDRYLKNFVPPDLRLRTQPPNGALAGLPTYFMVSPPAGLRPRQFGAAQVQETVTITPAHYTWTWGDASPALHTDDPGGPYPDGTVTHTYQRATHIHGSLTTAWSATYTVTVAGETFGPYGATGGTVQHTQSFALTVDRARSHLVSPPSS